MERTKLLASLYCACKKYQCFWPDQHIFRGISLFFCILSSFVQVHNHLGDPWRAASAMGAQGQAILHETSQVQRQKILLRLHRNPGSVLQFFFIPGSPKRQLYPTGGGAFPFPCNALYSHAIRQAFAWRNIVFRTVLMPWGPTVGSTVFRASDKPSGPPQKIKEWEQ